jgi:hypothetical protein
LLPDTELIKQRLHLVGRQGCGVDAMLRENVKKLGMRKAFQRFRIQSGIAQQINKIAGVWGDACLTQETR